ncbi:MAG: protein kinase [Myxococcota bacterium]|nr:protein kinase [Myxococcota bacterium]MDW8363799.1 serine/threonine-protein kinase [Myxococcales bacterium]
MGDVPSGASASARPPPSGQKGPDPLVGRVINDRFRITALIARGGMGKVYRAEQAPLGREVALKILNPTYQGDHDPEFHKRFFLEASICSKLTHPNTITIFDYGRTDDDIYYIAMELLEGRTLHRALREDGRFEVSRALHIARQICRSLREAHGMGVIHRDLKPANIFLVRHGDENDFVKVLDFGLVKNLSEKGEDLTQTGLFMGSPKYMSPEQIRGEKVDARTDIYALGVILYEMLTGKVPFDRPNSVNILMAHVHEAPPPMSEMAGGVSIPPAVEAVVMRCMAKRADERFRTMDEVLVALKQASTDAGLSVSRSGEHGASGEFPAGGAVTGAFPVVQITGEPTATPSGSLSPATPVAGIATPPASVPAPPAEELGRPRVRGVVVGAVVGAAALIGLLLALGRDEPATSTAGPSPAPANPPSAPSVVPSGPSASGTPSGTDPAAAGTESPPSTARVMVSLRSEPPGAMVFVGDRQYGPTPAEVEWIGADAEPGREVTLRFQKDGYRDYTVTRRVSGDRMEVVASLQPITTPSVRRNPVVRRPRGSGTDETEESSSGPAGPIKGYKTDPY